MKKLTIEKLVPLLISSDWRKHLVGEYYETIVRLGVVKNRLEALYDRLHRLPPTDIAAILSTQTEIDQMQEQLYAMKNYEAILYRRLAQYGIPYVDILSGVLDAADVMTDLPEPNAREKK